LRPERVGEHIELPVQQGKPQYCSL
jgi:hypothetical protein